MTGPEVVLPGVLDGRPVTDVIQEQFPGVWAWYGQATGSWWALVPLRDGPRLVEAINPGELRYALKKPAGWPWPRST
ncbi:hypothetical protein [Actinomadura rugatobispora]|uniref:Uncharacterized protein n=1 Tax=Actinomadura rugatobispora TaxID=1994 RepID=A0ABW1ABT1_9ACTN|nr:hypothetical protein GCM10010200_053570 [Actinomadura rugatobispora]